MIRQILNIDERATERVYYHTSFDVGAPGCFDLS